MPRLPAICDSCGAVFPSGYSIGRNTDMAFVGNISGPCPICNGMGRVPDGSYSTIADALYANIYDSADVEILNKLKRILKESINRKDYSGVKESLNKQAPNWKNVWNLLPEENISTAFAVYMFVLALIQTAILIYSVSNESDKPIEKNTYINQSFQLYYDSCPKPDQQESQQENQQLRLKPLTKAVRKSLI